ncbi:heme ABC transporter ATP-binding protein [Microbacterium thalli]|uniref:heme ABC transporter ATP-binding protein n=1 Tax=Microbacterium thalli TaxID=3027921 RepID=UPI0023666B5B|nr:heme ABC transporter ATP-binding protein [Microbacterium thalli]MDD7928441.1 heme ABC transporter ATP-binding protein [Microbacterium thalli]
MTSIAFEVQGVGLRLGGATILRDVSLEVHYGRLLALVGPNGAGKSSLLSLLTRDQSPTTGRIMFDARPLSAWSPRELARRRAVLLQANQVAFPFTGAQVVGMGRSPWIGTPQAADDGSRIAAAVAQADVAHLLHRAYPSMSGGEQARVSLARVLAQDAPVVLLDEPTAALDLRHQEDVLRVARRLAAAGRAVVVVLHDLSLAAAYADEVAMIDGGAIVAHGDAPSVLTAQRIGAVYRTAVRVFDDPESGRPVVIPRRGPLSDTSHI